VVVVAGDFVAAEVEVLAAGDFAEDEVFGAAGELCA
jgi:hypothetical protein